MKNRIIYSVVLLMSFFAVTSCTDSFLDVKPTTSIPGNSSISAEGIRNLMIASYQPLQWYDSSDGGFHPLPLFADALSDNNFVGGSDANDNKDLHDMATFNVEPATLTGGIWINSYRGIFRVNTVINKIQANAVTGIEETEKQRIEAEAYALRSFYYYLIWKFWGNIPYFPNNPEDIVRDWVNIKQYSADELYLQIIDDLDYALEGNKLPQTVADSELGRMTRSAALMTKANMVLLQKDESRYNGVLADMESIISSGNYSLYPDFGAIWESTGEWCSESIFEINYTDQGAMRGWGDKTFLPGGSCFPTLIGISGLSDTKFAAGWGFMTMYKSLYDLYDDKDQRKNSGILSFEYYKATENPNASYKPRWKEVDTGFFNKKYLPRKGENAGAPAGMGDLNYRNNVRIFRIAEAYLIASELSLFAGSQSKADNYLNMVRARAYKMSMNDASFIPYKQTASRESLLLENRLEFAGEGHRFFDLVRFGEAERVLGPQGYTQNKRFLPIPQGEVDKSLGTLMQNPY